MIVVAGGKVRVLVGYQGFPVPNSHAPVYTFKPQLALSKPKPIKKAYETKGSIWLKRDRSQLHHPRNGGKQSQSRCSGLSFDFNESTRTGRKRLCDFFY
jgi:hypothetical protein